MYPKPKLQCFISYCRDDNDLETIKVFKKYLDEFSSNKIHFFLDEETRIGSDLEDYMDNIDIVDVVIILLTPEYKRKAEERVPSGVLSEYKKILTRLDNLRESNKKTSKTLPSKAFSIIPIIFTRDFKNTCPNDLKRLRCINFSDFQITNKGKVVSVLDNKYSKLFNEICDEIFTVQTLNNSTFERNYQKYKSILFDETKHDNIVNSSFAKIEDFYVKTNSYYSLREQKTYFFLGRKGSGKSTLGPLLYKLELGQYKEHTKLDIDNVNLEYLYNITLNNSDENNDIGILVSYPNYFRIGWEILIYVQCFFIIVTEYEEGRLEDDQKKYVPVISDWLQRFNKSDKDYSIIFGKTEDKKLNSIFQWCLSAIIQHINNTIRRARTELSEFHFDINDNLSIEESIVNIIDINVLKSFHSVVKRCNRRFLISFDGFDTKFERFRMETLKFEIESPIREKRILFERGFLEGFLDLIHEIKSNKNQNVFYGNIDFCITVPKDRFFEIKNSQRDAYRYINKFHEIKWSGVELSILLRKRLELLFEVKTDKQNNVIERLNSVLTETLPTLPKNSTIYIGEKGVEKEVFLDVLRHTFWRPREILIYYAKIITYLDDFFKKKRTPTSQGISRVISETTLDIIENEFLIEFQNYCLNLKDIINLFKDSSQIFNFDYLSSKIGSYNFYFIDESQPQKDISKKIDFLYDIGFLGIELTKKDNNKVKVPIQDFFVFNESNKTYEILKSNNYENCNFIVHPIFFEYLGLENTNSNRLTLDIEWDYLMNQDAFIKI